MRRAYRKEPCIGVKSKAPRTGLCSSSLSWPAPFGNRSGRNVASAGRGVSRDCGIDRRACQHPAELLLVCERVASTMGGEAAPRGARHAGYASHSSFRFPWWGYLLGTYVAMPAAGEEGMVTGLKGFQDERSLGIGFMLTQPFRKVPEQTAPAPAPITTE